MSNGEASQDDAAALVGAEGGAAGGATPNQSRRYFLIGATSAVAGVGAVGVAVPFVSYWNPSARAKALGAPIKIDISKLLPGEMLTPIQAWRGKPIFVMARTPEMVEALENNKLELADPDSENPEMQPDYAANGTRSMRSDIGVFVGLCTHLGCSPKLVEIDNFDSGEGGFFCPCHGSRFDFAGRVGVSMPAPDNLPVPPHRYESDTVIVIGEEEGAA